MFHQQTSNLVQRIVTAVAEKEGIDPLDMEPPLATVIEPEALEQLLRSDASESVQGLSVHFNYHGHDIVVSADGTVDVQ